jgi:Amt family ammonium transporter
MATLVYFQFVFAAITLILLAGSLLGRMNFMAWMLFVPLWLTFSYTVGKQLFPLNIAKERR